MTFLNAISMIINPLIKFSFASSFASSFAEVKTCKEKSTINQLLMRFFFASSFAEYLTCKVRKKIL